MRKFRITKQQIIFHANVEITESNRTYSEIIECDNFKLNKEEIPVTEENLERARLINPNYNVDDIHICPLNSVSFFINGYELRKIDVFADPYYKLEEFIDDKYVAIDKHEC